MLEHATGRSYSSDDSQRAARSGVTVMLGAGLTGIGVAAYLLSTTPEGVIGSQHGYTAILATPWGWVCTLSIAFWAMIMFAVGVAGGMVRFRSAHVSLWTWTDRLMGFVTTVFMLSVLWYMVLILAGEIPPDPLWLAILGCAAIFDIGFMTALKHGAAWRTSSGSPEAMPPKRTFVSGLAIGSGVFCVAVLWQFIGPVSAQAERLALEKASLYTFDVGEGENRLVRPFGGTQTIAIRNAPILGSPDATHLIVSFFDYTDPDSRSEHRRLVELRDSFGTDAVAILPIVYPINADCNPQVDPLYSRQHAKACGYARLSLAVYRAAPDQFESFHKYIIGVDRPEGELPSLAEATTYAETLAGNEVFALAHDDAWIDRQLAMNIRAKPDVGDSVDQQGIPHQYMVCTMWGGASDTPGTTFVGTSTKTEMFGTFARSRQTVPLEPETQDELLEMLSTDRGTDIGSHNVRQEAEEDQS